MHANEPSKEMEQDNSSVNPITDASLPPGEMEASSAHLESTQEPEGVSYQSLSWQGPLPPPGILAAFDKVIDNGAERLFRMGEKEQDNRLENDRVDRENIKKIVNGQEIRLNLGQITSSSIALAAVLAGVVMVFQGRTFAGGGFIAGTAAVIKYLKWDGKSDNDRFEIRDDSDDKAK